MTADRVILEILDETTQALIQLDMPRLLAIEERAKLWASSTISIDTLCTAAFQQKHRQLGLTLDATAANLRLFQRVFDKRQETDGHSNFSL